MDNSWMSIQNKKDEENYQKQVDKYPWIIDRCNENFRVQLEEHSSPIKLTLKELLSNIK